VPESYRILMYDEKRYPSTLYIRVPLSIGPGLCRFLHVDFAEKTNSANFVYTAFPEIRGVPGCQNAGDARRLATLTRIAPGIVASAEKARPAIVPFGRWRAAAAVCDDTLLVTSNLTVRGRG
jgi:hypothetical protein